MNRIFHLNSSEWWRKGASVFLAFFWFLGLLTGILMVPSAGDSMTSVMRAAASCRVSISGLLSAVFLPFLFSAFVVYIRCPLLLLPIAFVKAFLFSYLGLGVMTSFGSAGWLVRMLLMFSDTVFVPVLFWFWMRYISGECRLASIHTAVCSVFAVLVGSFDYLVISPFLADIITL